MTLGLEAVIANAPDPVEEDGAFQGVLGFALIQFAGRASTLLGAFDPVEGEERALDPADLAQRQRQPVRARIGSEPFKHQRGADHAGADRNGEAQQVRQMALDQVGVDPAGDEGSECGARVLSVEEVQPARPDIGNARRKAEAEQMAQGEDMIGDAAAIHVVFRDGEVGRMVEKAVEDMSGFPRPWRK